MTGHALEVLEFERVLERVAARATSELGRQHVLGLRPSTDERQVAAELGRVAAVGRFLEATPTFSLGVVPGVREALEQLSIDGVVLEPSQIRKIGVLLATSRTLRTALSENPEPLPELKVLHEQLVDLTPVEKSIARAVDDDGEVRSTASRELKRIRDRLRGAHARLVRKLETYLGTLDERFIVSDASITIREGRYVIPIRREGRGDVGGIVHDESQTGATLFVEPPVAIEAMNELRELEREELREIRRILVELCEEISPSRMACQGALHALADFDSLYARARTATAWNAVEPSIGSELELRGARHPLLVEAGEGAVVPYDLALEPDEHCLVVTGPNTGGKSVFLKAVGLISALAQSGVIPPVDSGSRLRVFGSFFADIGDEQSIAQSLSTFSAHLANLSALVERADADSLVLIDEMGTGTDPAEGAALARAVIEELVARGATAIVSSHLGELKQLDAEGSGIVNASLQFDSERMEPTYRLLKGLPGRSYGLAIARRLGFAPEVLDRAEAYRDDGAVRLEDVLARLEQREREVETLAHELDLIQARTERLRSDVEGRESTLKEAERTAEDRAKADARKLLMDARAEVERVIAELREAVEAGATVDEAATEARRRVEKAAGRHRSSGRSRQKSRGTARPVEVGSSVRISATGAKGLVVERRGDRAVVEVGSMRFEVPVGEVEAIAQAATPTTARPGSGGWSGPTKGQVRTEIDLRGLRVDEMELELSRALDDAVLEDLSQLRIIHGKGTGALRKRVGEMLESDSRVTQHRMGAPMEGGAGVTVATLGGGA